MNLRRLAALAACAAISATPAANACSIVVTPESEAKGQQDAFRKADFVVTVDVISEAYLPVPESGKLRSGVATARVVEAHKGPVKPGQVLAYRVVDGEDAFQCPALRATHPGGRYKLYLDSAVDGGPLLIRYRSPFLD